MKSIPLSLGYSAIVDDADFKKVSCLKWYASHCGKKVYAKHKNVYMHRFIIDAQPGLEVDHINGNGLDNRRENLRLCTHAEQQQAFQAPKPGKTSQYRGVSWVTRDEAWTAHIHKNKVQYYLGYFQCPVAAAKAYDAKAKELFGEFAHVNFP